MTAGLLERIDALLPHAPVPAGTGKDAAGAAITETVEAPVMPDPDVVGVLMDRLAEIGRALDSQSAAINSQAVAIASLAGEVRALVTRVDSSERDRDDHEHRLRDLERARPAHDLSGRVDALERLPHPDPEDHETRLRKLERMAWLAVGAAAAGGGTAGAIAGKLFGG